MGSEKRLKLFEYRISSDKRHQRLSNFETGKCGAY